LVFVNPSYYDIFSECTLQPYLAGQAFKWRDSPPQNEVFNSALEYWKDHVDEYIKFSENTSFHIYHTSYLSMDKQLTVKLDRIETCHLVDFIGGANLASIYLGALKPTGKMLTNSFLSQKASLKGVVDVETGKTMDADDYQQLFDMEVKHVPPHHNLEILEWSRTEKYKTKTLDLSAKFTKLLVYITSTEGAQALMYKSIMESISRYGQGFPVLSVFGFMKLVEMAQKKWNNLDGLIDKLLQNPKLIQRRLMIRMASAALRFQTPLFLNNKEPYPLKRNILCVEGSNLSRWECEWTRIDFEHREPHMIGLLFNSGVDYDKAIRSQGPKPRDTILDNIKMERIDLCKVDFFSRIVEFDLPENYIVGETYDHDAMQFCVYDYRHGLFMTKPIPFIKIKVCAACKKQGENFKLCSRCLLVSYCSVDCQKSDWKVHKPNCIEKQ
jgi:hypothetical protein